MSVIQTATGAVIGRLNWSPHEGYTIWMYFPMHNNNIRRFCFETTDEALRYIEETVENLPEHFKPLRCEPYDPRATP